MENALGKASNGIEGYRNPSFDCNVDYASNPLHDQTKYTDNEIVLTEATNDPPNYPIEEVILPTENSSETSRYRRKNSLTRFLEKLSRRKHQKLPSSKHSTAMDTTKNDVASVNILRNFTNETRHTSGYCEPNSQGQTQQTQRSPFLSLPPIKQSKENSYQKCILASRKFGTTISPTQDFSLPAPRRAISLREHSRRNINDTELTNVGEAELEGGGVARSNSDRIYTIRSPPVPEKNEMITKSPQTPFRRGSWKSSSLSDEGRCENKETTLSSDALSPRRNSDQGRLGGIVSEKVDYSVDSNYLRCNTSKTLENELKYLRKNFEEYVLALSELLLEYDKLKEFSPERFRHNFDRPFGLVGKMLELQCAINKTIMMPNVDLTKFANVFLSEGFKVYEQYMVMFPNIYTDIFEYKDHFDTKFPLFRSLIMFPASRLNIYVQILQNLLKYASTFEKKELQIAIDYLEDLKRNANMELTRNIVKGSPIDLHLEGRILHMEELHYVSGPLHKRSYYLIAFENLLLITISKVSSLTYVTHYRSEQIVNIGVGKNLELMILSTLSYIQGTQVEHCFKISSCEQMEKWLCLVEEWTWNIASYEMKKNSPALCMSSYSTGKNVPVSLWQVFPFLKVLFTCEDNCKEITSEESIEGMCSSLVNREVEYIEKLNNLFNPDTLPPPPELRDVLLGILNLHEIYFLPALQEALKKKCSLVVDVYIKYIKRFTAYKTYLLRRCLCTTHMPDGNRAQHYILPVQHLAFHVAWARELGRKTAFREASELAENILLNYITDAKVMLLHEAIPNCYLDFYRTGEILKGGRVELKVRPRKRSIRDGTYLLMLFEKILLILKTVTPTYQLVLHLWLNQVNFGPPSTKVNVFNLEYRQGGSKPVITVEIKTQDESSKKLWMDCFTNQLQSQSNEIKDLLGVTNYLSK